MTPMPAQRVLDHYFLEARARLLDLAAIFDRIDRGGPVPDDPRLRRLQRALDILRDAEPARAERLQLLFSLEYDPDWVRPIPRDSSSNLR